MALPNAMLVGMAGPYSYENQPSKAKAVQTTYRRWFMYAGSQSCLVLLRVLCCIVYHAYLDYILISTYCVT